MFDVILNRGQTEHAQKYERRLPILYLIILTTLVVAISPMGWPS